MTLPYVRQGMVYFVPVLRHRLDFAVQVQRAVHELQLDDRDLIAVGLPESVGEPMLRAITRLPRIALVLSSVSDSDQREVFPVTPSDGIVEAVRIAMERQIPLRFVDQEVAPGHLLGRFCVADEEWPDDGLALQHGAEWHLDLVAGRLSHPPSRFEPVDSWRELHMAAQLQRIHSRYRRILFVCNATHVRPIQELLRQPVVLAGEETGSLSAPRFRILEPSLTVIFRYLDHIPRLVQQYEQERAAGTAHEFDKKTAVLRLIYELNEQATDVKLSIRNFHAFTMMLERLMDSELWVSPHLGSVMMAADSCFSSIFQERVFRHLLGYYDQVKVERVNRIKGSGERTFMIAQTAPREGTAEVYVARNCSQNSPMVEFFTPSGRDDLPPNSPFTNSMSWPPSDDFINSMRSKANRLALATNERQVKSLEFQGSMHDGLDFRRTLRSYYRGFPKMYVRQEKIRRRLPADRNGPTLWLSDRYSSIRFDEPGLEFSSAISGSRDSSLPTEWYLGTYAAPPVELENVHGRTAQLYSSEVHARLTYHDWGMPEGEIREWVAEGRPQLPDIYCLSSYHYYLDLLADKYGVNIERERWWEVMLISAVDTALDSVVVIAPVTFTVPAAIQSIAAASGKRIIKLPSTRFTVEERRKLGVLHFLEHDFPLGHDHNDPKIRNGLVEQFSDAMKSYW